MSARFPFRAVLRSEWTKLWSIRSTWWCTVVYVVVVGGGGRLAAAGTDSAARADVAVQTALTGFGIGQLVLVVLGALVVTNEFTSGLALVSLIVVPRRSTLLMRRRSSSSSYCPGVQRGAGGGLRARGAWEMVWPSAMGSGDP